MNTKKTFQLTHNQNGIALLASLMLVIIFTLIGMTIAQKGRVNQEITSSNVRHEATFEAAEHTLREAIKFLNLIPGDPVATDDGTQGRDTAKDFNIQQIIDKRTQLVSLPTESFVWEAGALEKKVCTGTPPCPEGIDFKAMMDSDIWTDYAIQSDLTSTSDSDGVYKVDAENPVNNINTYTFIQIYEGLPANSGGGQSGLGSDSTGKYYLITVKASGYPPGVTPSDDHSNSRENVLLQSVFLRQP